MKVYAWAISPHTKKVLTDSKISVYLQCEYPDGTIQPTELVFDEDEFHKVELYFNSPRFWDEPVLFDLGEYY